ncbi:fructose-6-phosphate aldolase [Streptococcus sp. DD13]|uniref:fructose-6-phosphate aldolase n=1 Tax=Streptococcus sp. DD13 TaxID=1777881 RepID=UPI000793F2C2|nr:fructose-6-phosphate aldolase [Streptococcus sp. DD13]KXT77473.1 Transaldolase [Streptococcus sp. DD13]
MGYMLDTANLEKIKICQAIFPLVGVTTNPSIFKMEGKLDVFEHLRAIRQVIGKTQSLHVQVVSTEASKMVEEAENILSQVDEEVYIKVPVTIEGLKAIKLLKEKGVHVTATAIYSEAQAYLAIDAGVEYIAPYFNRMESLNIDVPLLLTHIAAYIEKTGALTRILGASFKNIHQVNQTLSLVGHDVTVDPTLLLDVLSTASIKKAVSDFQVDWESVYGAGQTL